jgi:hypothetical protein
MVRGKSWLNHMCVWREAMIYLKQHNLIFLKTRKTASTSFEVALSAHATGGDVLTPISGQGERMRLSAPLRFAQNWARSGAVEARYRRFVSAPAPCGWRRRLERRIVERRMERARVFGNHMAADKLRALLGDRFDAAHKLCIVRHPYEVLVSFAWMWHDPARRSFAQTVDWALGCGVRPNHEIITLGGDLVADHMICFERLSADIAAFETRFGLSVAPHLPRTKSRSRGDMRPAREQLSRLQMARCYEQNALMFEMMGYGR